MDIESGGSLVFMATLADSLSFHKHTIAVLPIMLICILLLCVGTLQVRYKNNYRRKMNLFMKIQTIERLVTTHQNVAMSISTRVVVNALQIFKKTIRQQRLFESF